MPPPGLLLEALRGALPSALAAAFVCAAVPRLGGRRSAPVASALALLVGFGTGNAICGAVPLWPDGVSWHWLPWAALAGCAAELLARLTRVPVLVGWLLRAGVALAASRLLVPDYARAEAGWLPAAFAAAVLGGWAILKPLARRSPAGLPLALALAALGGSVVLIHAHTARLCEAALVLAAVLAGLALVGGVKRADAGGAVAGVAVLLPGLLLAGQTDTFSDVALASFALIGLAPLALAPALLVPPTRAGGWRFALLLVALTAVPAGVAVALAVRAESLDYLG